MKKPCHTKFGNHVVVTIPVLRLKDIITHINQLVKAGYDYDVIRVMSTSQSSGTIQPHFVLIRKVVPGDPVEIIKGDNKNYAKNYYDRYFKSG